MSVNETEGTKQHRRHPPPLPPPVSDGSGVTLGIVLTVFATLVVVLGAIAWALWNGHGAIAGTAVAVVAIAAIATTATAMVLR